VTVTPVAVVTPTWQRHDLLLGRCIPSVQAQGYPAVEHLVVSDGPDPVLAGKLAQPWLDGWRNLWYAELPEHDAMPHWGHLARLEALSRTDAPYITYCDDDDALRPQHCGVLAQALDEHPDAGFAVSWMLSHSPQGDTLIGGGELAAGNVGTPMILHRRELLDVATWGPADPMEDWAMVWAWLRAGVTCVRAEEITSDVWPSVFW
jgi:hypothetical protein